MVDESELVFSLTEDEVRSSWGRHRLEQLEAVLRDIDITSDEYRQLFSQFDSQNWVSLVLFFLFVFQIMRIKNRYIICKMERLNTQQKPRIKDMDILREIRVYIDRNFYL